MFAIVSRRKGGSLDLQEGEEIIIIKVLLISAAVRLQSNFGGVNYFSEGYKQSLIIKKSSSGSIVSTSSGLRHLTWANVFYVSP